MLLATLAKSVGICDGVPSTVHSSISFGSGAINIVSLAQVDPVLKNLCCGYSLEAPQ